MGKRCTIFFILFLILLFAIACTYSPFDKMRGADFSLDNKYEGRDIQDLSVERGETPDGVLASATLLSSLLGTFFKFPPTFFSPNTHFATTFSVLRC